MTLQVEPAVSRRDFLLLQAPVSITLLSPTGPAASCPATTVSICRHGAIVSLNSELPPGQRIRLHNLSTNITTPATVVGSLGDRAAGRLYALSIPDSTVSLWGVRFPPGSEPPPAPFYLECSSCRARQFARLDLLECEVFRVNSSLDRHCASCGNLTSWRLADHDPSGIPDPIPSSNAPALVRVADRRKTPRSRLRMPVCVRSHGRPDLVLESVDVSRGGFAFLSSAHFQPNEALQVALPFAAEAANIFVPATIVGRSAPGSDSLTRYSVAYTRTS